MKNYKRKKNYSKRPAAVKTVTQPKKVKTKVNYRALASGIQKQNNRYGTISKLNRAGEIFPEQLRTKLRCSQFISVVTNSTAPVANDFLFKANSMLLLGAQRYQPVGTVAASFSPQYASGLATLLGSVDASGASLSLYTKYYVVNSYIKIEIINSGASATQNIVASLIPVTTNNTLSSSHLDEQPYIKSFMLPSTMTTKAPYLSNSLSTKEFLGVGDISGADDNFAGTFAVEPANLWFWNLRLANASASAAQAISVDLKVTQIFDVIFFNRKYLTTNAPA